MDDVDCRGNESALDECEHSGWGDHNCGHHEDVSLICVDNLNLTGNTNVRAVESDVESRRSASQCSHFRTGWSFRPYPQNSMMIYQTSYGVKQPHQHKRALLKQYHLLYALSCNVLWIRKRVWLLKGILSAWFDDVGCRGNEISLAERDHSVWLKKR